MLEITGTHKPVEKDDYSTSLGNRCNLLNPENGQCHR